MREGETWSDFNDPNPPMAPGITLVRDDPPNEYRAKAVRLAESGEAALPAGEGGGGEAGGVDRQRRPDPGEASSGEVGEEEEGRLEAAETVASTATGGRGEVAASRGGAGSGVAGREEGQSRPGAAACSGATAGGTPAPPQAGAPAQPPQPTQGPEVAEEDAEAGTAADFWKWWMEDEVLEEAEEEGMGPALPHTPALQALTRAMGGRQQLQRMIQSRAEEGTWSGWR